MNTSLLQLHSVDLTTRTLNWESVHKMAAKTLLTVFYTGSPTTGSYIVVALQEDHTPIIYSLVGQCTGLGSFNSPNLNVDFWWGRLQYSLESKVVISPLLFLLKHSI